MNLRLHATCPAFLTDFDKIWNFMTDYHKTPKYQT